MKKKKKNNLLTDLLMKHWAHCPANKYLRPIIDRESPKRTLLDSLAYSWLLRRQQVVLLLLVWIPRLHQL